MAQIAARRAPPKVLVVVDDPLVAADLVEAVGAPGGRPGVDPEVLWLPGPALAGYLASGALAAAAVLALDEDPLRRALARRLSGTGCRITVLADDPDPEAAALGWCVSLRPVLSDRLAARIRAQLRGRDAT